MAVIGHVSLPSSCKITRVTDSARGKITSTKLDKYYDEASITSVLLPTIRYSGFMQATNEALSFLDALIEQFVNPSINYPLFINIDEEFYFLLRNFNYERPPGYKDYFRFNLEVLWVGSIEKIKQIYINEGFTKEENDWGI